MKKYFFIATMILLASNAMSQGTLVSLTGGYASANIEESDTKGTGWRINGNYEFNYMGGKFSHGVSFGYINLKASANNIDYTINSFPLYYAPKFTFGQDKLKVFLKGALGMQYAGLKRAGTTTTYKDDDFGFYGGGGAGLNYFIKENLFLTAEYEIAWVTNSFYKDGWISSIGGGIGYRF
jgi:hypothetical protein